MNEVKWTPGPWYTGHHGEVSSHATGGSVATIHSQLPRKDGHDEREANAHLIAASPELYSALEGLMKVGCWMELGDSLRCIYCGAVCVDTREEHQQHRDNCRFAMAKAALKKARGEQ
jgi:hypothetical protein